MRAFVPGRGAFGRCLIVETDEQASHDLVLIPNKRLCARVHVAHVHYDLSVEFDLKGVGTQW